MQMSRKAQVLASLGLSIFIIMFLLQFNVVKADDKVVPENYPMGYFIEQNETSEAQDTNSSQSSDSSQENSSDQVILPKATRAKVSTDTKASAPSDLISSDTSLPRKDAIDISSYQSWMNQSDFNKVKSAGVKYVVVKLTQNTNYTNPYAANQMKMAKAAGMSVATYHYAIFGNAQTQSAANTAANNEATYYAKQAKALGVPTNTVMILDVEDNGVNRNKVDWTTASQTFANKMKSLGYPNVKFYTARSWTTAGGGNFMEEGKLGAKKLWIAQYLFGKPSSSNLQNTNFGSWQYSSQMYFVGTSSHNPIDTSIDYSDFFKATSGEPYVKVVDGKTYGYSADGQPLHGQYKIGGYYYMFDSSGIAVTGFYKFSTKTCYYDKSGHMLYGQQLIGGYWYLFNKTTGAMETGFEDLKSYGQDKTVYYDASGHMVYGQQKISGHYYMFDEKTGSMQVGFYWHPTKIVYYNSKGWMLYGEQLIKDHWYLFDKTSGAMKTGFQNLSDYGQNKTVYYNSKGWMLYGQQLISDHWYLFDKKQGTMKTGFQNLSSYGQNKTVYYNSKGWMIYGQQLIGNYWYLFDKKQGTMKTGFQDLAAYGQKKVVYYDGSGHMVYNQHKINGHYYMFDLKTGSMKTGFYSHSTKTVYYNSKGWMLYGQQLINNHWYLFDKSTGAMQYGQKNLKDYGQDKWVLYDRSTGVMLYGFQDLGAYGQKKRVYYDTKTGAMKYGEQNIGLYWYLFDKKTGAMQTGFQNLKSYGKNKTCYYETYSGHMLYGKQVINGKVYYFDLKTGALIA